MKNVFLAIVIIFVVSILSLSCAAPELSRSTSTEYSPQPPPLGFTTYTSEGLFSISYPEEWSPALSILEEAEEWIGEYLEDIDPEIDFSDAQMIFFAGGEYPGGYYPSVNIIVAPRSIGYYDLDEICENEIGLAREILREYNINFQTRTTIDGRETEIIASDYFMPDDSKWSLTQMLTVEGKFVWVISCGCETTDFPKNEDDFDKIIRSIRILN